MRSRLIALTLIVLAVIPAVAAAQDGPAGETTYMAVILDGKKIGYVSRTRTVEDGVVTTTETSRMTISRLGVDLPVLASVVLRETADGQPLSFKTTTNVAGMTQAAEGTVAGGRITGTTESGGMTRQVDKPWPEGALLSHGLRLLQQAKGLEAGTSFDTSIFSPDQMTALPLSITVGEAEEVDLFGRVVELTAIQTTMDGPMGAISSTEYVDAECTALKSVTPMLGVSMEMIACDKAYALGPNETIDVMMKATVDSPVRLSDQDRQHPLTYHISFDGDLTVPADDGQSVTVGDDGAIAVTVRPGRTAGHAGLPYRGKDAALLAALEPTRFVESDNEDIAAAAGKAIGGTDGAYAAAAKLEAFVNEHIDAKSFGVGYASAAEVFRSKQGDCSEHAVLLAALCRSVGIPTEVVVGILYVDSPVYGDKPLFGGHAWVRCYIDGQWVHFDATPPDGFDTGHIMLGVGDKPGDLLGLLNVFGNFHIMQIDGPDGQPITTTDGP